MANLESSVLMGALEEASQKMNRLTTEELKDVLNDDEKIETIIADMKFSNFKHLDNEKEKLMASNRSLAEVNLAKQPQLEEGKRSISELIEKGIELGENTRQKRELLKEKSGSMSVESALELLQSAAAELEEETEKLAETFLSGEYAVDEFLEKFLIRKKLVHLRKVKIDKMRELMRKSTMKTTTTPGYPTSNYPGMAPGAVPYPLGDIGMPMPIPPSYRPF
ncbi:hypothetical protein HCN44_010525 [Aphidius gifuensis]|uniref:VPS37 C-terminal domain-containing protein n=1 Tax=Aphidius gifuensis TaxID=684658 RepID=A0A835CPC5_APHGI|nr:vacuolar protein sorting-associated protein 37B [Aphidius gifuensis]KAF7991724.1 hypothetical protein HCN44_010525 [Aphidius gifuensis]